ncbi:hypothetical protein C2S52_000220 [Perilla frutescens var. hirtella]|nr:hypothetical protein C2S52_000220 [Perilla frutescens var. hirtella]
MAPVFGTIDMLKPGRSVFGLELRLIRCYKNSNSGAIECVFHDRQAARIHVTIPGSNTEKFNHRLIEGSVYALIDFVIGLNIMKYRTTSCIHKIIIFKHSRLFEVFHEEFPKSLFELKTFKDIANMDIVGESAMFDVMGTIVSHYRPQHKEINGKITKLMDVVLEDLEGNTITCTLWENYVDEMIKFLDSRPEAPVGMIIQLCRPNIFRDEVRISTLFNVTKILTDQKLEDIAEFTFSYLTTGKVRSTTISTLTSSSSRTLNDEIKDGDFELKTISQILSEGKGRSFEGIPAGIEMLANRKALFNVSVQLGQTRNYTGSFSVARISCDREIIEKVCGKSFSIEEEESVSKIGAEKVEEMVDSTEDPISSFRSVDGKIDYVAIQKTIQQLIDEKQDQILDILPTEIDEIVGAKGFFKVIVMPEKMNGPFTVVKETVSKSKGKKKMHENANEVALICDGLETPPSMKSTTDTINQADLMNDDQTNRKLIDEFSSNALKKRLKRNVRKD